MEKWCPYGCLERMGFDPSTSSWHCYGCEAVLHVVSPLTKRRGRATVRRGRVGPLTPVGGTNSVIRG